MSEVCEWSPEFAACCGRKGRFDLSLPFVQGGKLIASDGIVLVWRDTDVPMGTGNDAPPDAVDLINQHSAQSDWEPFAMPTWLAETAVCPECEGSGSIPETYKCDECGGHECGGHGDMECNLGHVHECDECEGSGRLHNSNHGPCATCSATGKVPNMASPKTKAFGRQVALPQLARAAAALTGPLEYAPSVKDSLLLRGAGCGAIVMQIDD